MNFRFLNVVSRKGYAVIILLLIVIVLLLLIQVFDDRASTCSNKKYQLINPQIICNQKQIVEKKNYVAFKTELVDFIEEQKKKGLISEASIYFRDLKYGPTFGIDEYAQFSPASLLKLPLMITYLGLSEDDQSVLETKLYFENINTGGGLTQTIVPTQTIEPNMLYTVAELIEYMITYSDNKSYYVLLEYLNQLSPNTQLLRDTFIDLGVIDPSNEFEDTLTVKSYAGIFTQLYNSTYFTKKETSERALEYLSRTDFNRGIVAGVPEGIPVAHKFGERINETTGIKQLHDCGIVYYPKNPYLICIMTRGNNMDFLMDTLSIISKMMYQEFDSRKID